MLLWRPKNKFASNICQRLADKSISGLGSLLANFYSAKKILSNCNNNEKFVHATHGDPK